MNTDPRNRLFVNPETNDAPPVVYRGDDELHTPEAEEIPVVDVSPDEYVEKAMQEYEKNLAKSKDQRWKGQERWQGRENEQMRLVRIYHPNTFIRKLQAAGVAASFNTERSQFSRVWLNDFERVQRIGVNAWMNDEKTGKKVARTITTLQVPSPEYSIMRFNEYNVPTNEKYRGWRTALLSLILKNIITEEEADKAFGKAIGPASEFYNEQLFGYRRVRLGLRLTI